MTTSTRLTCHFSTLVSRFCHPVVLLFVVVYSFVFHIEPLSSNGNKT